MKDTLLIGDFLFVNKMSYGYSRHSCPWSLCPFSGRLFGDEPERGDVIVFKHPVHKSDYIKRLVGLPGDRIQMVDGVLHINEKPSVLTPDGEFEELFERQGPMGKYPQCEERGGSTGNVCTKSKFIEEFPDGFRHSVLDLGPSFSDDTRALTVPEDHYFFVGDNRDNSQDSRYPSNIGGVGFVPFENLIGRADRVIFSSAGRSMLYFWTWRRDRFFKAIQ